MAGEGPPFLTVGTDVSAKYRGAFCEAKVKVVKKLVKCKINFKSGTSCIVSDDFVKGTLKIGAKVEAKMTENGQYEEGTIMKLNDASLYTVVFDDGDEKTLRRTLLCLQGEKHFHESETLDHLPLTDPENFGTPVMKDSSKMRRKRRMSNRSQRSEDEEEEEDEEEDDSESDSPKKQRKEEPEDAVGKIVIVEMNEKRKNSFFPALVVDPSCTKDVQIKGKDYIVVRSFKDNKFYTVTKSSRKPFLSKDHSYKGDLASLKAATEKAVTFIDTGQLPSNWDMEMLKKKKRTGKQGQVESDDDTSEDSSDDEYDMEKDAWLASLHKFMEERGTPINKPPVLGFRDLNLYKLYKLVQDQGGCRKVTDRQMWRHIMTKMGIPVPATQQPYNIHTSYNKYLFAFEEFNRKMGPGPRVFTRTRRRSFDRGWISPPPIFSRQRSVSKQGVKDEPSDREEEEESPSKKRVTRKKGEDNSKPQEQEESKRETREAKSRSKETDKEEKDVKKLTKDDKTKDKSSKDIKDKGKDKPTKEDNVKEKGKDKATKAEKDKVKDRLKDTPSKDGDEKVSDKTNDAKEKSKDTKEKAKAKDEKVDKSKEGDKMKEEKSEEKQPETKGKEKGQASKGNQKKGKGRDDDSNSPTPGHLITGAGYDVGEKVLVHYGRGRTEKIYEAKVVDIELKGKDHVFTVHYTGWNNRYDEAVKKSRIVGSAEKKKKKLTPKGKPDKEKNKKDLEKKEREEQQRKEKEEAERREREENERKAKQARELKEKQEAERLEKARLEKERQEKERQEKLERERKEKQEKERLEKERKEKQEREKRERLEREREEKELKERLEKEQQDREKKEKQEKEKKEKQEKDRREKLERERKEKEKMEQEKEAAEAAKEAEREQKEKASKEVKKTPTGKRGRPSLSKSSPAPQTPPRTTSSGRGKSPSPASVFSQRSMRSDRKSLTESPFAMGLNVRSRSKRSSTGECRRGAQDESDSEMDELDAQSESQQSTLESEDSQLKDSGVQESEDHDDNESTKTEDYAATLTKVSEEKPSFDEDLDEGPPTLTAEVAPESIEDRLQEVESEAPKVEEVEKASGEKDGRLKAKKEPKIRLRKSLDKERDGKDSANESLKGEKMAGKDGVKDNSELDDSKEKIDETPVLERQVPMEAELKEKLEDLKQETKSSASDADKPTEKKKGRRKGRKSTDSRKRSKAEAETGEVSEKSEASEASEPKKKHAKVDRRKSDKGGKKSKTQETKTLADNTDSDFGTSSVDDKSIPGTSKSFMTTPPTTPESSPKMPSSPAQEEDLQIKVEEQSSNKSDSDALIEVANIDDRDTSQPGENSTPLASSAPPKKGTPASASQQGSPKKRRRGTSELEPTKKRRKHSRRRQSSISERRLSAKERGNNNSSDTDESRSESRLTSSSAKRPMSLKKYAGSLPPSRVADSSSQDGTQKQRRWNFLVDLSNVKEPDERIAIIQHQLSELRSVYLQLKQEVATIDRRRKKFRKKEREAAQVMAGVALGHCLPQGQERAESGGS